MYMDHIFNSRVLALLVFKEAPRVTAVPGQKSVSLSWIIIPCSLLNITGFTIRLDGKKDFKVDDKEHKYQLKQLKPYTEYNIAVKAETLKGNGIWSDVKRIRTTIASRLKWWCTSTFVTVKLISITKLLICHTFYIPSEPTAVPNIISIEAHSSNSITIKLKVFFQINMST